MSTLKAMIEISRPHNMVAAAGCVFAGYLLSGGGEVGGAAGPVVFTGLVTGLGNLINDFYDREIDRVNKPSRPIPSGRLSPRFVVRSYAVATIVLVGLMPVFLPFDFLALAAAWVVLLYVYARWAKRVALIGNLLIASVAASAFLGGAILSGRYTPVTFPVVFAFLLVMGRELVKGAEDVEGDGRAGAATLAVRCGVERTLAWSVAFLYACVLAVPIPGLIAYYGRGYTIVMELLFVPGVLFAVALVLRAPGRPALRRASSILKLQMFFGIVAIALGRA